MIPKEVLDASAHGLVLALTGAGVSAESGIPTFRGEEGYWRVGSRHYQPQEMATWRSFSRMPEEVWAWYLYRRGICARAEPNPGHLALVELERALGDDFLLVTQNVDGLHGRAGSSPGRTYEIHGRIDRMRCSESCTEAGDPIPAGVSLDWPRERRIEEPERALLVCPRCGARARPHVLWFDESYDEAHYRFRSSLEAASRASLLVVAGTSGATNLPTQMVELAASRGAAVLVLNADPSPFSELAEGLPKGAFWKGPSGSSLPALVAQVRALRGV